jgi:hypothetical protein
MNSHDKSMNFQAINFPTSQAPGCQGLKGGHQCLGQVVDGVFGLGKFVKPEMGNPS